MAVVESKPEVGSSSMIMLGLMSSSWPTDTRLRSPPLTPRRPKPPEVHTHTHTHTHGRHVMAPSDNIMQGGNITVMIGQRVLSGQMSAMAMIGQRVLSGQMPAMAMIGQRVLSGQMPAMVMIERGK